MDITYKRFGNIFLRYLILILIAIVGLKLFYALFLPLTKYPVFFGLQFFYDVALSGNSILLGSKSIEIVGACIAGSAYYLLLILNLATSQINWVKRIKMILLTFGLFLILNIVRIYILSIMYLDDSPIFDATHKLFWYLGSTIFVVLIWFFSNYVFKVKTIPFYSDLKYIYPYTKKGKDVSQLKNNTSKKKEKTKNNVSNKKINVRKKVTKNRKH